MEAYSKEYLEHFGILGMKWGHRKANDAVSPNPNPAAGTNTQTAEQWNRQNSNRNPRNRNFKNKKAQNRFVKNSISRAAAQPYNPARKSKNREHFERALIGGAVSLVLTVVVAGLMRKTISNQGDKIAKGVEKVVENVRPNPLAGLGQKMSTADTTAYAEYAREAAASVARHKAQARRAAAVLAGKLPPSQGYGTVKPWKI